MEKHLLIPLLFLIPLLTFAQDLPCKEKYYNNRCKERYLEDSEGQVHGKYISYSENGAVDIVAHYSHGKLQGTLTQNLGSIKIISNYLNGIENGLYQKSGSNGEILEKGNYVNGLRHGKWVESLNGAWVDGRQADGGIVTGNYNNGKRDGIWINVAVEGCFYYKEKRIVGPISSANCDNTNPVFYKGFKTVFENGKYIQGFNATGNNLDAIDKVKQDADKITKAKADSINRVEEKKLALQNMDIGFNEDSYYIRTHLSYLSTIFPESNILLENKPVKIIIVGHTKEMPGELTEDQLLGAYILSLNRAYVIKENIRKLVGNAQVTIDAIGVGNIQTPGSNPDNGITQIFINEVDPETAKVYNQLRSKYGLEVSNGIINNFALLRVKLWNIYMNIYGSNPDRILLNVPWDFKKNQNGVEEINPHIKKAIEDFPRYKEKIQAKQLTKEDYQKQIQELLLTITQENFK